jgi:hypothetical protein
MLPRYERVPLSMHGKCRNAARANSIKHGESEIGIAKTGGSLARAVHAPGGELSGGKVTPGYDRRSPFVVCQPALL